jgi:hypothetical protein
MKREEGGRVGKKRKKKTRKNIFSKIEIDIEEKSDSLIVYC